jgi:hypothetical protein
MGFSQMRTLGALDRQRLLSEFLTNPKIHVIICNPQPLPQNITPRPKTYLHDNTISSALPGLEIIAADESAVVVSENTGWKPGSNYSFSFLFF